MKALFLILSFLITVQANVQGQSKEDFKVYVYYDFDKYVKNENLVKSYIERELRKLGDVELVQYEEYGRSSFVFGIKIVLVTNDLKDLSITGYTMFAVFVVKVDGSPDVQPYYLDSHWTKGDKDSWEFLTSSIIASFDQRVLRKYRDTQ